MGGDSFNLHSVNVKGTGDHISANGEKYIGFPSQNNEITFFKESYIIELVNTYTKKGGTITILPNYMIRLDLGKSTECLRVDSNLYEHFLQGCGIDLDTGKPFDINYNDLIKNKDLNSKRGNNLSKTVVGSIAFITLITAAAIPCDEYTEVTVEGETDNDIFDVVRILECMSGELDCEKVDPKNAHDVTLTVKKLEESGNLKYNMVDALNKMKEVVNYEKTTLNFSDPYYEDPYSLVETQCVEINGNVTCDNRVIHLDENNTIVPRT